MSTSILQLRTGGFNGSIQQTTPSVLVSLTSATVYNESISGPSSVNVGTSFTLNISGGAPNTNWSYNSGFISSSGTLDGSGAATLTVPSNAQLSAGTYNYDFFFVGSGNSKSKAVNAIAVPTYDEVITGPSSVTVGTSFTLSISGGEPNTNWSYNSGFSSSSGTLDGSGAATLTVPSNAQLSAGTYTYNFFFVGSNNFRSKAVNAIAVPTYNEVISGPISVTVSTSFTLNISGGAPNTNWSYNSGFSSSSGTLSALGDATITVPSNAQPSAGTYNYDFFFVGSNNSRSKLVNAIAAPTYTLSTTTSTVNEGSNVTIILDTTGVSNGTLVPFTITGTGIDVGDFVSLTSLTGNFNIRNNQSRITLDLKKDLKTELDETFYLTLTGRNENIGIIVKDTSTTTSDTVVKFLITSASSVIYEGSYATFYIKAIDLAPGTVVPYRIFGIQTDDIAEGTLTGLATFLPTGTANQTQANVTLTILDDKETEGLETIVLLLNPNFPYSLQLSSTIVIQDSSISPTPDYIIDANRTRVVEGSNVTFTLRTSNIPDGTIVPWRIIKQTGDITLGDFDRINSLDGYFPAISSNIANVTLEIRDDYLFEQSEFFYIEIPNRNASSPIVEIIDSGNTYLGVDATFTGNIVLSFLDPAILHANIGGLSIGKSYWKDASGQLSENMFLQGKTQYATEDSLAFYQPFSYVIRSSKSIDEWGSSIRSVLHPAGLSLFSEINNETMPYDVRSLEVKATNDTEIDTFSSITIDKSTLLASTSNLTVDSVTSLFNL